MTSFVLDAWETRFMAKIEGVAAAADPAHDLLHFKRVVTSARQLCQTEGGDLNVVVPSAWLHDLINVPKNDPRRAQASRLSAEAAVEFLREISYPEHYHQAIAHAIEAHSFSASIPCQSPEAKIVQDADRLDALGAIGIARCFATSGLLRRPLYHELDPFCDGRDPDDLSYTLDHFYKKLFKLAETLQTQSGRREGQRRLAVIKRYLTDFKMEIGSGSKSEPEE